MNFKLNVEFLFFYVFFYNFVVYYGILGQRIHVTMKQETYQNAIKVCSDLGLNLIRIENDKENNNVYRTVYPLRKVFSYWIDGNNINDKNVWVNSDNEKLNYTKWRLEKPNFFAEDTHCVQIYLSFIEVWDKVKCSNKGLVICYEKIDSFKIHVSFTDKMLTFTDAQDHCRNKGLRLIRIKNELENSIIHEQAQKKKFGTFWIDGNNFNFRKAWVNLDNELLQYTKFHANVFLHRTFEQQCIQGNNYKSNDWDYDTCYKRNSVICFAKEIVFGEQIHMTHIVGTFSDAHRLCAKFNLNVIRIQNSMDNDNINVYASLTGIEKYWIDGNNVNFEGRWLNNNNEPLIYTELHGKEYRNRNIEENCIIRSVKTSDRWDQTSCGGKNSILCYAKKVKLNSRLIISGKKSNFEEAQRYCRNIGFKLLRVENEIENINFYIHLNSKEIKTYWLDGKYFNSKGIWLNSDNETLLYTKWNIDNFKNMDNVKHCIIMNYYKTKEWKYEDCSKENAIICS